MLGRSILVVDDNPAIRRAICELFTQHGDFEICGEAENGKEALEKAQLLIPALIVTDISMPVLNGFQLTRLLKQHLPKVPVILFSIHVDALVAKEAASAGASAVVSKGDAAGVLLKTARELLDRIAA